METESKIAPSITIFDVCSLTSEKSPPITPANAIGVCPLVMTISLVNNSRSVSSNVVIFSPSLA